jgi:8-oxo-dGTP pyrophosphatase MutT (NUDIX family)
MIQQSGVVPVRFQNAKPLFLVINNRNKTRWIVPKGVVESGHTPAQSALKEAMEEAGIAGEILAQSLGAYEYRKWDDVLGVELFIMFVAKIHENWEEQNFRERRWIDWEEFLEIVDERIPRSILNKIPQLINFTSNLNKEETKP